MSNFVNTHGSSFNKNAENSFEVVTYEAHKPKRKDTNTINTKLPKIDSVIKNDKKGIDIKRARREIIKFGISGFDSQKQQEAKIALAVSLGAKPQKNKCINYKLLLKQKQQQKLDENKKQTLQQAGKNSHSKSIASKNYSNKTKRKREMKGLLTAYGKVGKKQQKVSKQK